jgi:hypothetical protein
VFERGVGYENGDLRKNDVNMDVVWVGRRGRSYRWRDERVVWWLVVKIIRLAWDV